jgi:hypothetical protein
VTFDDPDIESVLCFVQGNLKGDIRVAKGTDERIGLGHFTASEGNPGGESVMILCDTPDVELTIDKQRTPSFLSAKLKPIDKRTRQLTVWVEKNAITGKFPRQDDPFYYDSAVYITTGDGKRCLRVPVDGTAD